MSRARFHVAGELRVPGDKSISHRSLICSCARRRDSRVRGILPSADVHSTAGVLRALGVDDSRARRDIAITGVGLRGLREPRGSRLRQQRYVGSSAQRRQQYVLVTCCTET